MTAALNRSALQRWRANPITFIEEMLYDPETKRPFCLLPAERQFLTHAYQLTPTGQLQYPEQIYSCPKKSGKTTLSALHALTLTLLFGGAYPEATLVANDFEQAQGRVFEMCRRIIEASATLKPEARITQDKIAFPAINATISAIASDHASAAGGAQSIACFDELWAFTSERSHRLWDEMVPVPTRKVSARLTTTYAGFEGESQLLEGLYKRGKQLPVIGPDLHAGDGLLMFWSHTPIAPWQDESWLAEMRRSLRPNAFIRMIENRFVTSETSFIDLAWWDACVDLAATPLVKDRSRPVYVGIDASVKRDSTAVVVISWDHKVQKARLLWHRIFQPSPDQPLDFEAAIETTILDLHTRFRLKQVLFDPFQMVAVAQRLQRAGVKMVEYPQSSPNLTAASQNLYELIKGRNLIVYPDAALRLAVSRAVAIESPRGWRIAKEKQSHKIDVVVALAMAALAAVQNPSRYDSSYDWVFGDHATTGDPVMHFDNEHQRRLRNLYIATGGGTRPLSGG
jgi:phage terminase large subunit-like protein